MKKLFRFMHELVPNRRWFALTLNMVALGALTGAITMAAQNGLMLSVAFDAFAIGMLVTSTVGLLMMPGIFRTIAEGELAVMKAQLEKQFNAAYSDFLERHPEMRGGINPPSMRQWPARWWSLKKVRAAIKEGCCPRRPASDHAWRSIRKAMSVRSRSTTLTLEMRRQQQGPDFRYEKTPRSMSVLLPRRHPCRHQFRGAADPRMCRHLSVSVDRPGKLPNPVLFDEIAKLFVLRACGRQAVDRGFAPGLCWGRQRRGAVGAD